MYFDMVDPAAEPFSLALEAHLSTKDSNDMKATLTSIVRNFPRFKNSPPST